MEKIVNSIFTYNTFYQNDFFNKELIDKKMEKRINQIQALFQRWFSNEFQYNYRIINYSIFDFYILYNNKLYIYTIVFKDNELERISLIEKYIIRNPPYYIQLVYSKNSRIAYAIIKYMPIDKTNKLKLYNYKLILYKVYNGNKINKMYDYKNNLDIIIKIENNNIEEIHYRKNKYKIRCSEYEYIYDNEFVYHYKKIPNYYSINFCDDFRLFKLFI